MHGSRKSDRPIVPQKGPNKSGAQSPLAEGPEGRGLVKGNSLKYLDKGAQPLLGL